MSSIFFIFNFGNKKKQQTSRTSQDLNPGLESQPCRPCPQGALGPYDIEFQGL
jgi:hypothetical protein